MAASNKDSNVKINNEENCQIEIEKKVLGKGAFGIVYLGKKIDHKKHVEKIALKEIPKQLNDEESQKALDNEIEICRKLDNTNIVKMIKIEKRSDKNYIVYELCNGGDLRRYMDYFKTFDEELIQYIMIKMCNALFELHRKEVVHHDIKAENILIQLFPDEKEINSEFEKKIEDIKKETSKDNTQNNNQLQNNNQYQTNYNNLNQYNNVYIQNNNNNFINNNMNTNPFNQNINNNALAPNLSYNPGIPMGYTLNIPNNNCNPNYSCGNNNFNGNFNQPNNCLIQNFNICNIPNNNINYQYNNNLNDMNYATYQINNNLNIANNINNMNNNNNNNNNINNYNNNNININNNNNNYNINYNNNNINNINQNNIIQNNINQNMINQNMINQNIKIRII